MKPLVPHTTEYLPPEMLLDEYHPSNDTYIKSVHQIQRQVVQASALLKPKHVDMVKQQFKGFPNTKIAEQLDCSQNTVSKVLNSPNAKRLLALLTHHQVAVDGPNEAQRLNMLWRIAIDNEKVAPKTSVSASAEITRMTGLAFEQKQGGRSNQPIIININQDTLPRGVLDA